MVHREVGAGARRGDGNAGWSADTVLNLLLFVLEVGALTIRFLNSDLSMFQYYTQCSNLFAGITGAVCVAANLGKLDQTRAHRLKFCACATQLMTFIVVVFVLMPMVRAGGEDPFQRLFLSGVMPVTHFLGPLLTIVSYYGFESDPAPTPRQAAMALLPTVAYAIVAYTCNYLRIFEGPYPFLLVWEMPVQQTLIWVLVLMAVASLIVSALWLVARLLHRPAKTV